VAVTPAVNAVAARIPVANVISMTACGSEVRAFTGGHELVRIDARTNAVTLRVHVADVANGSPVVAGGGALWLDGPGPAGHARLLKIDPANRRDQRKDDPARRLRPVRLRPGPRLGPVQCEEQGQPGLCVRRGQRGRLVQHERRAPSGRSLRNAPDRADGD
jgi:hypothetical protein